MHIFYHNNYFWLASLLRGLSSSFGSHVFFLHTFFWCEIFQGIFFAHSYTQQAPSISPHSPPPPFIQCAEVRATTRAGLTLPEVIHRLSFSTVVCKPLRHHLNKCGGFISATIFVCLSDTNRIYNSIQYNTHFCITIFSWQYIFLNILLFIVL